MFSKGDRVVCVDAEGCPYVVNGQQYVVEEQDRQWLKIEGIDKPLLVYRFQAVTPSWHDKPTGPGLWYCVNDGKTAFVGDLAVLLTQADLDRGAPFHAKRVFGPIPADPTAQEVGQ